MSLSNLKLLTAHNSILEDLTIRLGRGSDSAGSEHKGRGGWRCLSRPGCRTAPRHRFPCPNRASLSRASDSLGRSRSTPGQGWTPRTVTRWNGGCFKVSRRFRASSSVSAMKALTLRPRVSAYLLGKFVVKRDRNSHDVHHNRSSSLHHRQQPADPESCRWARWGQGSRMPHLLSVIR